jgi:hypothetical protein
MARVSVTVTSNVRQVAMDILAGAQESTPALVRALNKTATQVRTRASREIRAAGYNLKAADVKKALTIKRASSGELVASVIAKGRPIPLIKYGARQTARGVSVQVMKGRKVIAHAFIATMPNGHTGVYVRTGAGHTKVVRNGKASWHGLPIEELFGPSVPDGLANKVVQQLLQEFVADRFPDILEHEHAWLAGKLGH